MANQNLLTGVKISSAISWKREPCENILGWTSGLFFVLLLFNVKRDLRSRPRWRQQAVF